MGVLVNHFEWLDDPKYELNVTLILFNAVRKKVSVEFIKKMGLEQELADAEGRFRDACVRAALEVPLRLHTASRAEWLEVAARAWDEAQVRSVQNS